MTAGGHHEFVPIELDHITVAAADFAGSVAFYDAALGALGLERSGEFADEEEDDPATEVAGWGEPGGRPVLWLVAASATGAATGGMHLCLRAGSETAVTAFHRAAEAAGGRSHARPRRWPLYRRGEFSAAVADPEGNLIEVVAPESPRSP